MNRPSTIVGLAAVILASLVGCASQPKSATPCRDEYVRMYTEVLTLLKDASPKDPDIDDRMKKILGTQSPKECKAVGPLVANNTLERVAQEFGPQLAAFEDKWGPDTISGFRDPMNAGHGQPRS